MNIIYSILVPYKPEELTPETCEQHLCWLADFVEPSAQRFFHLPRITNKLNLPSARRQRQSRCWQLRIGRWKRRERRRRLRIGSDLMLSRVQPQFLQEHVTPMTPVCPALSFYIHVIPCEHSPSPLPLEVKVQRHHNNLPKNLEMLFQQDAHEV